MVMGCIGRLRGRYAVVSAWAAPIFSAPFCHRKLSSMWHVDVCVGQIIDIVSRTLQSILVLF